MPRQPREGSISASVVSFLETRKHGATLAEIADAIDHRRGDVQRHSIRSAVLSNLDGKGMALFERELPPGGGRGAIYRLAE